MSFITVQKTAEILGEDEKHIYYLLAYGELTSVKIRWVHRLWEKEVLEYAAARDPARARRRVAADPNRFGYLFAPAYLAGHGVSGDRGRDAPGVEDGGRLERIQGRLPRVPRADFYPVTQPELFDSMGVA